MIFVEIALTIIDPLQLVISLPIDHINKSIEKNPKISNHRNKFILDFQRSVKMRGERVGIPLAV
jgi:hypothetical protein